MEILTQEGLLESYRERIAASPSPVLFLDYDGTLAPFREKRDEAVPYEGLRELLTDIMENTRSRVVIVTGRPIEDFIPLLDIDPMPEVFGTHGWERLHVDGTREIFPLEDEIEDALEAAHDWITENNLADHSEYKPASVTLHWRGLPDDQAGELEEKAKQAWKPIAETTTGVEIAEFDEIGRAHV